MNVRVKARVVLTVLACVCVSGCDNLPGQATAQAKSGGYEYAFKEKGSAETQNKSSYQSLGDITFVRSQKYEITDLTDATKKPHVLAFTMTKRVGKKVIDRDVVQTVLIKDGSYTIDCNNYYDIKIDAGEDSVDDPVCSIQPIGILEMSAPATLKS